MVYTENISCLCSSPASNLGGGLWRAFSMHITSLSNSCPSQICGPPLPFILYRMGRGASRPRRHPRKAALGAQGRAVRFFQMGNSLLAWMAQGGSIFLVQGLVWLGTYKLWTALATHRGFRAPWPKTSHCPLRVSRVLIYEKN